MSEPAGVVESLRADRTVGPQLAHALYLPPSPARYGELDPALPEALARGLERMGVERLWSHQAEGLAAARRGENVLVTTPTASGKSLIFQLPVLERALAGGDGVGLFLYPLKALGQDQKAKFDALVTAAGLAGDGLDCRIYDGDTPRGEREKIRDEPPRVVISNPDMVHLGLLGSWQGWAPFLRRLEWVVLDELHTYRGVFGSHFHHVLERLLRLCREEGSAPRVIASSATAANAGEFAERLTGRPYRWIEGSGAPREGRHFLLVRPVASPYTAALQLLVRLLGAGLKTIVFTKARRITELLYQWLRQQEPRLARRVGCYRSGFLAGERRRIERRLFDGELDGVISTSALEMGIDVGGLDACVLVGYPGSVMATWQRSGRVGRAGRESITALVALPDALDQYLLEHPDAFVDRPCERLVVDPANEPISRSHLICAAAERPLRREGDAEYLRSHAPVVGELLREHRLVETVDGDEITTRERRPQRRISLRGAGATSTILETDSGRVVGTVDGVRVLHECHPGAVYLHRGRQYLVRELDLEASKVHAEPVRLDYFTTPLTEKETTILEHLDERREGPLCVRLGRLRVSERVVGYQRKRIQGQELLGQHELELPPVTFETVGLWWLAPAAIETAIRNAGEHFMGSLHAAEHAAISLFPLHALCDRGDIGGISMPLHPQVRCGSVFVYDGHPGGVGIAAKGFEELPRLLERVLELLGSCDCEDGCPSCVQSPKCGNGNRPLDKAGAAHLLRLLLGQEQAAGEVVAPEVEIGEPVEPGPAPVVTGRYTADGRGPGADAVEVPIRESVRDAVEAPIRPPVESPSRGSQSPGAPPGPAPVRPPARADGSGTSVPPESRAPVLPPIPLPISPDRVRETVIFDLETRRSAAEVGGWNRAYRMLLAVGVVLHLEEGRFEVFREEGIHDLIARLEAADLVIGFNSRRFDYRVLNGYTGIDYGRRLPTLDLLEQIHRRTGFRVGLNHLASATLGVEKTADGLQSLEWVRQGDLERVEAYCRRDVEILRDLYLYGRRMGYLVYRDRDQRRLKLPVDW